MPSTEGRLTEGKLSVRGLAHLMVVYVAWGSTYLAIRVAVREGGGFAPFVLGATRTLCAAALLLGWNLLRRNRVRPTRAEWRTLLPAGLLMWVGGNGLVNFGETRAASGYAALLVGTMPMWAALVEGIVDRRRPSLRLIGSLSVGFAGLGVLAWPVIRQGATADLWAVIALVLAPLCWSTGSILLMRRPVQVSPAISAGWQQLVGGIGFAIVALLLREPPPHAQPAAWGAWAYLVVVGSVFAISSYLYALRLLPLRIVTTYAYANPVIAVFLGWLILGEKISGWTIGGTALVLAGIAGVFQARFSARKAATAAAVVFLACAGAGPATAHTLRVELNGSGEFTSIQAAIQSAGAGDTVSVGPGTYPERINFGGRPIVVVSRAGAAATVIDAGGTGSVVTAAFLEGPGSILDGFTLRHGSGTRLDMPRRAGVGAVARLGTGAGVGAGIDAGADAGSTPGADTGAAPDAAVETSRALAGESSPGGSPGDDRTFRYGGGIFLQTSAPTLRNLVLESNWADYGGGLYALQSAPVLSNCRFVKNTAGWGGGLLLEMTDGAEVNHCLFERNRATEGGAVHLFGSVAPTRLTDCIAHANTAADGSAVLLDEGSAQVSGCTIAGNAGGADPAAIHLVRGAAATIEHCLLADPGTGRNLLAGQSTATVSCTDTWPGEPLSPGVTRTSCFALDPRFCWLAGGDLRLRPDSPCLPGNSPYDCGRVGAPADACSPTGGHGQGYGEDPGE
jgi:drug/metabolite transporter (DMT)-like permease